MTPAETEYAQLEALAASDEPNLFSPSDFYNDTRHHACNYETCELSKDCGDKQHPDLWITCPRVANMLHIDHKIAVQYHKVALRTLGIEI